MEFGVRAVIAVTIFACCSASSSAFVAAARSPTSLGKSELAAAR